MPSRKPPLHATTSAARTGLGKELAGSASAEDGWMEDARPWDASTAEAPRLPPPVPAALALRLEIERAAQLRRLRALFRRLCETAEPALAVPPMHALERWRFVAKWEEDEEQEPCAAHQPPAEMLFPLGTRGASADARLAADLVRAGMHERAVAGAVCRVREASREAAAAVASAAPSLSHQSASTTPLVRVRRRAGELVTLAAVCDGGGEAEVDGGGEADGESESEGEGEGEGGADGASIAVTEACLRKLVLMHNAMRRHAAAAAPPSAASAAAAAATAAATAAASAPCDAECLMRVYTLLLRYHSIGGAGFQAALGGRVLRELHACLGVNFECFASPLNAFYSYASYCSAFPDVDAPFGSRGSFASFSPSSGAYEVNPPFVEGVIDAAAVRIVSLLERAEAAAQPLCFVVALPGWDDCEGYRLLSARTPFLRHTTLAAAVDHGFVDGAQHRRRRSFRESPYDTAVMVLQTSAAAQRWPACGEAGAEAAEGSGLGHRLRRALAACTPTADALAAVDSSERVHRGGGARAKGKRQRWGNAKRRRAKKARAD